MEPSIRVQLPMSTHFTPIGCWTPDRSLTLYFLLCYNVWDKNCSFFLKYFSMNIENIFPAITAGSFFFVMILLLSAGKRGLVYLLTSIVPFLIGPLVGMPFLNGFYLFLPLAFIFLYVSKKKNLLWYFLSIFILFLMPPLEKGEGWIYFISVFLGLLFGLFFISVFAHKGYDPEKNMPLPPVK